MSPAAGAVAAAAHAKAAAMAVAEVAKKAAAGEKKEAASGTMKLVLVSEEMSRFAGGPTKIARPLAVQLVWAYVKAYRLQDKREINCDALLKRLFGGRDKVGVHEVSKLLDPHFLKN